MHQLQIYPTGPTHNFAAQQGVGIGSMVGGSGHLKEEKTGLVPKEGNEAGVSGIASVESIVVVVGGLESGGVVAVTVERVDGVQVLGVGFGVYGVDVGSKGVDVGSGSVAVDQRLLGGAAIKESATVALGLLKYLCDIFHVGDGEEGEPGETKTLNQINVTIFVQTETLSRISRTGFPIKTMNSIGINQTAATTGIDLDNLACDIVHGD